MSYETLKAKDYGVNLCASCLEKQCIIDRQFEEIQRLKQKLNANERRLKEGFFASSTPSSQIPVKANLLAENQARRGGAKLGHKGVGRKVFNLAQADEVRVALVAEETCETCRCQLVLHGSNERAISELQREEVRQIYYSIERKRCPVCRRTVAGKVENAMPQAKFEHELIAEVAEQHYVLGRTLGQIAERFGINYSTLSESLPRVAKQLAPCLEKLKADYRQSVVRHADACGVGALMEQADIVGISVQNK